MAGLKSSLKINTIFNAFYQILALLVPLITTPYISRTLGANSIGQYSFFYSIITYFTLVVTFGFTDYGTKRIAETRENISEKSLSFFSIYFSKLLFGFFCLLIYFLFSILFFSTYDLTFVLVFSLYIISVMIDPVFFFQGEEKFISICIKNSLLKLLSTVLIFVFVKSPNDLTIYTIILASSQLISTISLFFSFRKSDLKIVRFKDLKIVESIKKSFPYFIPALAISLFTYLNQTLLGLLVNDNLESGYYGQAIKVINILATLAASLSIIMLSRISYLVKKGDLTEVERKISQTFEAFWVLSLPLCFGLISINSIFTPLFFGEGYSKCVLLIYILSPTVIFSPLNGLFGSLYFRPQNKIWIQTIAIFISSIVNILLSLILMPSLKSTGACIARLVAELVQLPVLIIFSRTTIKPKTLIKTLWKPLLSSVSMAIILLALKWLLEIYIANKTFILIIIIISGILIYGIMEIFLKEEIIISNLRNIANKIKTKISKN